MSALSPIYIKTDFKVDPKAFEEEGSSKICGFGDLTLDKKVYSVAALRLREFPDPNERETQRRFFKNEIENLRIINQHFGSTNLFVKLIHWDETTIYLERCAGTLIEVFCSDDNPFTGAPMSKQDRLMLARDITEATNWLHSHGIVHKDIKPENILINKGVQKLQLTDFAFTASISHQTAYKLSGTPAYVAPEAFYAIANKLSAYAADTLVKALDVWSLGLTLRLLMLPDEDMPEVFNDNPPCLANVAPGDSPTMARYLAIKDFCNRSPWFNIYNALHFEPQKRASAKDILNDITHEMQSAPPKKRIALNRPEFMESLDVVPGGHFQE